MPTNHMINAIHLIASGNFRKAIGLWRLYMRFRRHCAKQCRDVEPSIALCGNCLSCHLKDSSETLNQGLEQDGNVHRICAEDLDLWLAEQHEDRAA